MININGKTYSGDNITVNNNQVIIDGKNVTDEHKDDNLLNKTACQTIITRKDGKEFLKNKRKFRSEPMAQRECNELNAKMAATEMLNTYQCGECNYWHLGRNGQILTTIKKRVLIKENFKVTVVGFVDLNKFDKKGRNIKKVYEKKRGLFSPKNEIKLKIVGKIDLPK